MVLNLRGTTQSIAPTRPWEARRAALGIPATLSLLIVVVLGPALARGAPPDPTWIDGVWDAADGDDAALAASGLEAVDDPSPGHVGDHDRPGVCSPVVADPSVCESGGARARPIRAPPKAAPRH